MWEIRRYQSSLKKEWNLFVGSARNATFLFFREYMDYHSDRFADHSLLAYRNGRLAAILPANADVQTLYSHQGLTYGGWILSPDGLDGTAIFELWNEWLGYCNSAGIEKIIYKPLPYIYAEMPSQEDLYMLYLCGARLIATDLSSTIDLESNPGFNTLQNRHLKKTPGDFSIEIISYQTGCIGLKEFHHLLEDCLKERHSAIPVHSLDELRLLIDRFPDNIIVWGGYVGEEHRLAAAICVYETGMCAHCQYIATSGEGREKNLLAPLIAAMIEHYEEEGCRYFDFGISNEGGGRYLNPGLNRQKTSYGGSGTAYQRYEISVSSALESLPSELWPPP